MNWRNEIKKIGPNSFKMMCKNDKIIETMKWLLQVIAAEGGSTSSESCGVIHFKHSTVIYPDKTENPGLNLKFPLHTGLRCLFPHWFVPQPDLCVYLALAVFGCFLVRWLSCHIPKKCWMFQNKFLHYLGCTVSQCCSYYMPLWWLFYYQPSQRHHQLDTQVSCLIGARCYIKHPMAVM